MKTALLLALVTLFVSSGAHATDYVALYADADHTQFAWCGGNFTMYVFTYMQDHDMWEIEFKCVFPAFATPGDVTYGPDYSASMGTITAFLGIVFLGCHGGWWQICSVPITYTDGVGMITITKTDYLNASLAALDCNKDYTPLTVLNNLYLGQHCFIGTKSATWGAIRSLF